MDGEAGPAAAPGGDPTALAGSRPRPGLRHFHPDLARSDSDRRSRGVAATLPTPADTGPQVLNEEVAKLISRTGGIGVADAVLREMLKAQEVA
jgi:hypothetical protein